MDVTFSRWKVFRIRYFRSVQTVRFWTETGSGGAIRNSWPSISPSPLVQKDRGLVIVGLMETSAAAVLFGG